MLDLVDTGAELDLLSIAVRSPDQVRLWRNEMQPDMFSEQSYGLIWSALSFLSGERKAIDRVSVGRAIETLTRQQHDTELVNKVFDHEASEVSGDSLVEKLSHLSMRKKLYTAATRIATLAHDPSLSSENAQSLAREYVREATQLSNLTGLASPEQQGEELRGRFSQPPGVRREVKWGYTIFDRLIGPMSYGVYVVAGFPSHGKSSFAINVAQNVAWNGGRVLVFSAEMDRMDLNLRRLSSMSGVPSGIVRSANGTGDNSRLLEMSRFVDRTPLWIWDEEPISPNKIEGVIDHALGLGELDLIVVDQFQNLVPDKDQKAGNDVLTFDNMSDKLRQIAKVYDLPLMLLSQLTATEGQSQVPTAHTRWTKKLLQDAVVFLGIHYPYKDPTVQGGDPTVMQFHVLKNRHVGIPAQNPFSMRFDPVVQEFYEDGTPRRVDMMIADEEANF